MGYTSSTARLQEDVMCIKTTGIGGRGRESSRARATEFSLQQPVVSRQRCRSLAAETFGYSCLFSCSAAVSTSRGLNDSKAKKGQTTLFLLELLF